MANNNVISLTKEEFKALEEKGKYDATTDTIKVPMLKSDITSEVAFLIDSKFSITESECKYLLDKELGNSDNNELDKKFNERKLVKCNVDGRKAIAGVRAGLAFVAWYDKDGNKHCWTSNDATALFAIVGKSRVISHVIFE